MRTIHGVSAEVGLVQIGPDDAHLGPGGHVAVLQVPPLGNGQPGDVQIVLADAGGGGGIHRFRPDLHIARHRYSGGAQVQILAVLLHNVVHVLHIQGAGGAPGHDGDGEGVGAHVGEALSDIALQAVAQTHNDDDRRHADDDAQHGQKGAHLAGDDVFQGQLQGFQNAHALLPSSPPAIRGVTTASGASEGPS